MSKDLVEQSSLALSHPSLYSSVCSSPDHTSLS